MAFETLLTKYNSVSDSIYNQTTSQTSTEGSINTVPYRTSIINTSQPYIFIRPNTTTSSPNIPKGRLGFAFTSNQSRIKDDRREFPLVSSIRDSRRLQQFSLSPMGTRFITQQFALQLFNPYPKTRIWNPASVFASIAGPYVVGTNLVQRPVDLQRIGNTINNVFNRLSGATKNISSTSRTVMQEDSRATLIASRRISDLDGGLSPNERGVYGLNGYFTKARSNKKLISEFLNSINPLGKPKAPSSNLQDPLNSQKIKSLGIDANTVDYSFLETLAREGKPTATEKYDIITFTFGNVGNNVEEQRVVPFRAFISEMKENVKTEFSEQRYIGRTERFITYAGAKRNVTLQFKVAALSKEEIQHTWTRINYLTGLAFPKGVSGTGFMVPPLFRFTVGRIYQNQPCYIESLDYEFLGEDTTFDIDEEVSQVIKVNMTLQLIEAASRYRNSKFYQIMESVNEIQRQQPAPTIN